MSLLYSIHCWHDDVWNEYPLLTWCMKWVPIVDITMYKMSIHCWHHELRIEYPLLTSWWKKWVSIVAIMMCEMSIHCWHDVLNEYTLLTWCISIVDIMMLEMSNHCWYVAPLVCYLGGWAVFSGIWLKVKHSKLGKNLNETDWNSITGLNRYFSPVGH